MFLIVHYLSSMFKGNTAENSISCSIYSSSNNKFRTEQIENSFNDLAFHREKRGWFLENELNSRFCDRVRENETVLYLSNFVSIHHLI